MWTIRSWKRVRARILLLVSQLYFLRRLESAVRVVAHFATTALDFFLGSQIAQAEKPSTRKAWMIASVTSNLSMLGFFQVRKFPARKLPVAAGAGRHCVSAAALGYLSANRHFLLHGPFPYLHAGCLPPGVCADQIAPGLHARSFIFSTTGGRPDRPRG